MSDIFVPVLDINNNPLMPTIPSRARKWVKRGKATPFFNKGVFCVRLNTCVGDVLQEIVIGIDTGIKKEAYCVKSDSHTYFNVQADAVTWVKKSIEKRRLARKTRRRRKTPYRKVRFNRKEKGIIASVRSRWNWRLRVVNWIKKLYSINMVVIEDIRARPGNTLKSNPSLSVLQTDKKWFYKQLKGLRFKRGFETKALRESVGLKKSTRKLDNSFEAHCVDAWVLANSWVGGHVKPDNRHVFFIVPHHFYRRQLHYFNKLRHGVVKPYGGTLSCGWKRGGLIKHKKYGVSFLRGSNAGYISLHSISTGKILTQMAHKKDCKWLCYASFRGFYESTKI